MENVKSKVCRLAYELIQNEGLDQSTAMRLAWANIKLYVELCKGKVHFSFTKKDGTVREAYGTLVAEYLPEIKGTGKKCSSTQVYYDLDKNSFRSFRKDSLLIA